MHEIENACELAQDALWSKFWDECEQAFANHYPPKTKENWIYWWHAHALDVLLDAYARTKDNAYLERFQAEYKGVSAKNGGTFLHNWYDDMEWMALALIRAFDITGEDAYLSQAVFVWNDIKTAWNDFCGGGMAWKKDQPDYKNTPANGPAAILAFRLYQRMHKKEDLEWGEKILKWNLDNLMDPETGFVWDGINREGDGKIDYEWKFTYCQGVVLGAALEYAKTTEKKEYLELAGKIARRAVAELADLDGIFPYEGADDCGLFRGIFFRYVYELAQESCEYEDLVDIIRKNACMIAEKGMNADGLCGGNWRESADGVIDLAQHLSAVMTLEMAAKLQKTTSRKKIHLICNAHLDPVWLWPWEEGCTEALSTFRTAERFTKDFPGFRFNHNEALLYQWVKENEPDLYERIKQRVQDESWHIMGGWYIQPDCNMPAGESIIRNIKEGRKFFLDEFGKRPTTAINFDSFGHSKGLVQILTKAGYDSYVVCRPAIDNYDHASPDFLWKGFNEAKLIVHRSDENYNSVHGQAAIELSRFLDQTESETSLFLWGVGDHGGGASVQDLNDLEKIKQERKDEFEIIHSDTESYIQEIRDRKNTLPLVERGLNPVAEGCYTSQIRIKQKHRLLENEIYSGEKMLSAASLLYGKEYPEQAVHEAVLDLLFAEFHDALPGSGTQTVEEDTLRLLDHGLEIMSREKMKAGIALTAGEESVKEGTTCVFIYNPHPYEITGQFAFEACLPKQNWKDVFYYPVCSCNGTPVKTQGEMENSHFCIDWRKKIAVEATLKPSCMNRVDVSFCTIPKRPVFPPISGQKDYVFDNGAMRVVVNVGTGLIDSYQVDGVEYVKPGSFQLTAYEDTCNSWGIRKSDSWGERSMALLPPHEGSAFSGLADKVAPSVRIIEDGAVRTVVEALFGWHDSKAYQRYLLPKNGTSFEIETGVYWNEKDLFLKLNIHSAYETGDYLGQVMFGRETLPQENQEAVAQKWVAFVNEKKALAILNSGTYGSSIKDGVIGLTLLRSAGYSAADGTFERTLCEERHSPRMDQGERIFRYKIEAGKPEELLDLLDRKAQVFNEAPYALPFNPSGNGKKEEALLTIDNPAVILSALKKSDKKDGYTIRLYESTGKCNTAEIKLPAWKAECSVDLNPYEIKTLFLDRITANITETDLLD